MHMQGCDSQTAVSILGQAVLKSARIIEYASDFPFAVGVHISCVPNQEVTRTGMAYAFTALPDTKNSYPITIYENDVTTAEQRAVSRAPMPSERLREIFACWARQHPISPTLRVQEVVLHDLADHDNIAAVRGDAQAQVHYAGARHV